MRPNETSDDEAVATASAKLVADADVQDIIASAETSDGVRSTARVMSDAVRQWNAAFIEVVRGEQVFVGPTWTSRNAAIVHAAIFDAVNDIARQFEPYLVDVRAPQGLSQPAAALAAGFCSTAALYPGRAAVAEARYRSLLAGIPNSPMKTAGAAFGCYVGMRLVMARRNDGAYADVPFTVVVAPGLWRPTLPDFSPPLSPNWPFVRPFVIPSSDAYLPPPPPALTSPAYTADFNEVKALGRFDSSVRTLEQTLVARFWSYDSRTLGSPVLLYNQILARIATSSPMDLLQEARLFALGNLAMADATIVTWDAKYTYDHWRPVTGIRKANADGNPNTDPDPTWLPLGYSQDGFDHRTPSFPAYTSGHSAIGAATFQILTNHFDTDTFTFTVSSDEVPNEVRTFNSFSAAAQENGRSRVYMGAHWQYDNVEGLNTGTSIGDFVFANALQPL